MSANSANPPSRSTAPVQPGAAPRDAVSFARKRPGLFGVKAVGSFLPGLTRKAFEKYGFSTVTLLTDWSAIVGEKLAASTSPERLKWPRQVEHGEDGVTSARSAKGRAGATLVLRVDGSQALAVQYSSRQIIERINAYFGYAAIAELRIVQAPIADPVRPARTTPRRNLEPLTSEVAGVADAGLREALGRLGAGIRAR